MAKTDSTAMQIRYWGTTGSIAAPLSPEAVTQKLVAALVELERTGLLPEIAASPQPAGVRALLEQHLPFHLWSTYGGNTTCVEIRAGDELLVIDAGTGLRQLGFALAREWNAQGEAARRHAHVLLTHPHADHTLALPFVDALYDGRNDFELWATQGVLDSLDVLLNSLSVMQGIYFPPSFDIMPGVRTFHAIAADGEFEIGDVRVSTLSLNHPGGCIAYRFERAGRVYVFASDHEHLEVPDTRLAEFARHADVLYLDAQYVEDEYHGRTGVNNDPPVCREGWGHSTVEACVRTGVAAGVHRLHLGHLDPHRSDVEMARVDESAQSLMRAELTKAGRKSDDCIVCLAREGLVIDC